MIERTRTGTLALLLATVVAAVVSLSAQGGDQPETPSFRSGVDLINVTATVTDAAGNPPPKPQ